MSSKNNFYFIPAPNEITKIVNIRTKGFPCYVLRYYEELNCIQIEDQEGNVLNLVAWDALWNWLKKPIID